MLTLAVPALSLRLGASDAGNDHTSPTTRHAYDLLAKGLVPASTARLRSPSVCPSGGPGRRVRDLERAHGNSGRRVGLAGAPESERTNRRAERVRTLLATTSLVQRLRQSTLPRVERATATTILVGGTSATQIDFTHVLSSKLLLFVAVVLILSAPLSENDPSGARRGMGSTPPADRARGLGCGPGGGFGARPTPRSPEFDQHGHAGRKPTIDAVARRRGDPGEEAITDGGAQGTVAIRFPADHDDDVPETIGSLSAMSGATRPVRFAPIRPLRRSGAEPASQPPRPGVRITTS